MVTGNEKRWETEKQNKLQVTSTPLPFPAPLEKLDLILIYLLKIEKNRLKIFNNEIITAEAQPRAQNNGPALVLSRSFILVTSEKHPQSLFKKHLFIQLGYSRIAHGSWCIMNTVAMM